MWLPLPGKLKLAGTPWNLPLVSHVDLSCSAGAATSRGALPLPYLLTQLRLELDDYGRSDHGRRQRLPCTTPTLSFFFVDVVGFRRQGLLCGRRGNEARGRRTRPKTPRIEECWNPRTRRSSADAVFYAPLLVLCSRSIPKEKRGEDSLVSAYAARRHREKAKPSQEWEPLSCAPPEAMNLRSNGFQWSKKPRCSVGVPSIQCRWCADSEGACITNPFAGPPLLRLLPIRMLRGLGAKRKNWGQ